MYTTSAPSIRPETVQDWLGEGWTTLRIAGDADVGYAHLEIRDAVNNGLFEGPRIFGAGHYLSVTGGGGGLPTAATSLRRDREATSVALTVSRVTNPNRATLVVPTAR